MPRIKVLHYLNNIDIGGTCKSALLFAKHIDRSIFKPYLVFSDRVDFENKAVAARFQEFAKAVKFEWYPIKYGHGAGFQETIDHIKPDIIHLYRAGHPEFPQPGVHFSPGSAKVVETNVFGQIDFSPHIHKTLFMSKWLMDHALGNLNVNYPNADGKPRFDFINNPTETQSTKYIDYPLNGPKDDRIVLGRVGRDDNGIYDDISLRAIKILVDKGYPIEMVTVGTPSNMLKDLKDWDIPHFDCGIIHDDETLSLCYQSMDIFCHARADGETCGSALQENFMHGNPAITHVAVPKIPGMGVFQAQTVLVEHNKNGFVVDPYSVDQYAKYLEILINNKQMREDMGRAGFKKAMQEFHVYPVLKKLERIYGELVS